MTPSIPENQSSPSISNEHNIPLAISNNDVHWYSHIISFIKESTDKSIFLLFIIWYISIASFWEMDTSVKFYNYILFLSINLLLYLIIIHIRLILDTLNSIIKITIKYVLKSIRFIFKYYKIVINYKIILFLIYTLIIITVTVIFQETLLPIVYNKISYLK